MNSILTRNKNQAEENMQTRIVQARDKITEILEETDDFLQGLVVSESAMETRTQKKAKKLAMEKLIDVVEKIKVRFLLKYCKNVLSTYFRVRHSVKIKKLYFY